MQEGRAGKAYITEIIRSQAVDREKSLAKKGKAADELVETKPFQLAVKAIQAGELVAFPTETVYGLGADAFNPEAIKTIYRVKGRPQDNPLIVHLENLADLPKVAREIPRLAFDLFEKFAPGPLTLVLKRHPDLPEIVSAGLDTVAVRFPSHPLARAFIKQARTPLVAPSANLSGKPSPTTAAHVYEDLQGKIPYIIDGGPCPIGVESTVVDISQGSIDLLRPGGISLEALENFLHVKISYSDGLQPSASAPPKSPGVKYRHYAPRAKVFVVPSKDLLSETFIESVLLQEKKTALLQEKRTAFFVRKPTAHKLLKRIPGLRLMTNLHTENIAEGKHFIYAYASLTEATNTLFAAFRYFDRLAVDAIFAEEESVDEVGLAYMNRLKKAAAGSQE